MNCVVKTFLVIVFVLILVLAGFRIFNETILRSNIPKYIRTIIVLFFPPKDYYDYIVYKNINDKMYRTDFYVGIEHKYRGKYSFNLFFIKKNKINIMPNDVSFIGYVKCYVVERLVLSDEFRFISTYIRKDGTGITLLLYDVPEDLPFNEKVKCNISIGNFGNNQAESDDIMLVVKKESEI